MVRLPLPVAALARRLKSGALRTGAINEFPQYRARTALAMPLMASTAACGFPYPTDDYLDTRSTSTNCWSATRPPHGARLEPPKRSRPCSD